MAKFKTTLKTIDDVKNFVKTSMDIPVEVDVSQGKFLIDGASIMGLFSLNLSDPITVTVREDYINYFDFDKEIIE